MSTKYADEIQKIIKIIKNKKLVFKFKIVML